MTFDSLPAPVIADTLLQKTGTGLLTGDFELFSDCFQLPKEFETFEGRVVISTREQLRKMFETVRSHYHSVGLTDMVRHIVQAEYLDPETISSTHESRLLQGTMLLQEPYPVYSILKLTEDGWKITQSSYAALHDSLAGRALNSAMHSHPSHG